jgi:hypothetical protein
MREREWKIVWFAGATTGRGFMKGAKKVTVTVAGVGG